MKHLLLTAIILSISCNPFMSLNMMTGGAAMNAVVDAITTDVIIRTINDDTKVDETKIISVPTVMLDKFLEDADPWLGQFKYQGGYACLCAYLEVTKYPGNVVFDFWASPIEPRSFNWGKMTISISDEEWEDIKLYFPTEIVRNTDIFVSFKK